MNWITRLLLTSLTILAVPYVVSGVEVDGIGTALLAAFVLGILNVTVKPLLILLTLPFTLISFGLFLLVVNALVFQMAGGILPGLHEASFGSAFAAALVVTLVSWLLGLTFKKEDGRRVVILRSSPRPDTRRTRDLN